MSFSAIWSGGDVGGGEIITAAYVRPPPRVVGLIIIQGFCVSLF